MTLLQAVRDPGPDTNFTFAVDGTVTNLTVYITGQSVSYTVTSPSGETARNTGPSQTSSPTTFGFIFVLFEGESQQSNDTSGSVITATASVGNYINVQLKTQAGVWSLKILSANSYTVRVIGEEPCSGFGSLFVLKLHCSCSENFTILPNFTIGLF